MYYNLGKWLRNFLLSTDHLLYPRKSDGGISFFNCMMIDSMLLLLLFCRIPLRKAIYQFDSLCTRYNQYSDWNWMWRKIKNEWAMQTFLSHKFWKSRTRRIRMANEIKKKKGDEERTHYYFMHANSIRSISFTRTADKGHRHRNRSRGCEKKRWNCVAIYAYMFCVFVLKATWCSNRKMDCTDQIDVIWKWLTLHFASHKTILSHAYTCTPHTRTHTPFLYYNLISAGQVISVMWNFAVN